MRRVVILILDGLRRDSVTEEAMPNLHALRARGTWHGAHRTVFPSVTRCVSASFATGCHPARHGLQANTMALEEGGVLALADAGEPDFLERKRRATDAMLGVPTMAERMAGAGGYALFSNGSPGSARAHDPLGHGHVLNRAYAHGPGNAQRAPSGLAAGSDGDDALVERFIAEGINGTSAVTVCWCAEPDHIQHHVSLGSAVHRTVLAEADRRVARVRDAVDRRRDGGEDVVLLVGSDHGHETVAGVIDVNAHLVDAGAKRDLDDMGLIAVANGTASLVYALPDRRDDAARAMEALSAAPWAGHVFDSLTLGAVGQANAFHLVGAVALRAWEEPNTHGVPGLSFSALPHFGKPDRLGCGMHGGLGTFEQSPVLLAEGRGFAAGMSRRAVTSIVDVAPSVMHHLQLPADGFDGVALQAAAVAQAAE
jgi:hypothetical protein